MKSLIMLIVLLVPAMIFGYAGNERQRSDSYLGIYCSPKYTTSGYPRYDESVTYGERNELEFELSIVNEEGTSSIFIPRDFQGHLVIELTKDAEKLPEESLVVQFGMMKRKYKYDTQLSEQGYDSSHFEVLEPGIGLRTSFTLKRRDGSPFLCGYYKLICYFKKGSVRFEDGTEWLGRGGGGGSVFHILKVTTLDDQKRQYIIKGSEFLQKNQPQEALEAYQKLIELAPDDIGNYAWLGETYMRMQRYQEAISTFEKALPAFVGRERTSVPDNLAFCYVAVNREEKAREILKRFYGEHNKAYIEEIIGRFKTVLKKK